MKSCCGNIAVCPSLPLYHNTETLIEPKSYKITRHKIRTAMQKK